MTECHRFEDIIAYPEIGIDLNMGTPYKYAGLEGNEINVKDVFGPLVTWRKHFEYKGELSWEMTWNCKTLIILISFPMQTSFRHGRLY